MTAPISGGQLKNMPAATSVGASDLLQIDQYVSGSGESALYTSAHTTASLLISGVAFQIAPTATANYGLLSMGAGPFDGSTSGFFVGSSAGTHLAVNAPSTYTGDFINVQKAGTSVFQVTQPTVNTTFGWTCNVNATISGTYHSRTIAATVGTLDSTSAPANTTFDIAAGYFINNCNMGGTVIGVGQTVGPRANEGVRAIASGGQANCGLTIGVVGLAGNSLSNIGLYGRAIPTSTPNGPCVGVLGSGALGSAVVGGWFTLATSDPTFTSAALVADNGATSSPVALFQVNGTTKVRIDNPSGADVLSNYLNVTGTLPTVNTDSAVGCNFRITSAGSSSQAQYGMQAFLNAGYTGSSSTAGGFLQNTAAGTNTGIGGGNNGVIATASVTTAGNNYGASGNAGGGTVNIGVKGNTFTTKNNATNCGVFGAATNLGSTPTIVGGYFYMGSSIPTMTSAALIADNASLSSPVFIGMVNSVAKFTIDANGYPVILSGSGAPGGTPADGALYVDTTNFKLYIRCGGAWKASAAFT